MDLLTLNDITNQGEKLIENYDSLIWTERYNTIGDFEIQAGDVATFMNLLPEGKRVSLRESVHTMVVETHHIERKKHQPEKITIKGRSFESILDRRIVLPAVAANTQEWLVNAKVPSDISFYIVIRICTTGAHGLPILDVNDEFPTSLVAYSGPVDYYTGLGPTRTFSVPKGNLLDVVMSYIQVATKTDATTIPVTPAVIPRGLRAVKPSAAGTAVTLQWYVGTDRSATVYFDATRDVLDDSNYLFSKRNSSTTAYILGPTTAAKLNKGAVAASGLSRRIILVDGVQSGEESLSVLQQQAELSLTEASEVTVFDGSINQELSPYKYNVDYFLGDTVKLVGDYGLTRMATVSEYIRSEDTTGSKSYPTLTYIS